eukprot:CAMPEP_0202025816 /NCGR_PEP_ID=MMETSP0905-20130828/57338_1 /ASSEMBLY_ACC=CAM_ASM_000554 /TAXON_ID=420261 /ORGANISM="Thalassiosira antarctica, Strain CCMP982" /LENGTH=1166 /DNA_ID=CAMNT_0048588835 /DNA_START=148 /DNA_END=3644 /DNA_ORIENTATION=+
MAVPAQQQGHDQEHEEHASHDAPSTVTTVDHDASHDAAMDHHPLMPISMSEGEEDGSDSHNINIVVVESTSDEHALGLSLSRSPSPPSPQSRMMVSTSMMAARVSDDVLTAAVDAASSQLPDSAPRTENDSGGPFQGSDAVDASLLPISLLPHPTFTSTQQQHPTQQLAPTDETVEVATGAASGGVQLEARIMSLEQSLSTITQLCQTLLLQQQQQHSRQGSEATGELQTPPGNSSPHTPSPTSSHANLTTTLTDDSNPRFLSQWPPSHPLLESPDVSMRQKRKRRSKQLPKRRSSIQNNGLASSSSGESTGRGMPHSKTMSMELLDINLGESRGPNMIPFASDLDACDEMDGDSVAGGCRDGREVRLGVSAGDVTTGERSPSGRMSRGHSSGSENMSIEGSSRIIGSMEKNRTNDTERSPPALPFHHPQRRHKPPRRLSSSFKETNHRENNLECQAYTTAHLDALRLRREAGKGRAYSFNDSLLQWSAAKFDGDGGEALKQQQQWKPTMNDLDGSIKEPDSATSAGSTGTFVHVRSSGSSGEPKGLDITIPDLSLPDSTTRPRPRGDSCASSTVTSGSSANKSAKQTETKSVGSNITISTTEMMKHSISCASIMSSDTTKTLKSGNLNDEQVISLALTSKIRAGSGGSLGTPSKERSQSVSSSTSAKDGSTVSTTATGDAATTSITTPSKRETKGKSPHKNVTKKGKSPHKHSSQQQQQEQPTTTLAAVADNKTNQTMKEYVINDLLNIDSQYQEGSATEDIDENMEEFLRIPPKFEWLMVFSLAVCMDSFLYSWAMLPLKFVWGLVCALCSVCSAGKGIRGVGFHRRHLYPLMQCGLIWFVYSQVLCPISIGKLYHWIRGQAMLKLYVLIAIVEVFDRLLCSFGQDAWDSLYWNTTRRPRHRRMLVSIIVVAVYVTIHSLFLFLHVATLSVAVNSADNALLTLLISGNFAEIKSTVFKKYNKQNLFKIATSDICERFKLALFLLLILFINRFQGEMTSSMVKEYYSMCGIIFAAELVSDWIKHSFITKFNLIKSSIYFDYALILSGDVTGIGHEGLNLDYTHAAVKRLGLAQIPLVCVTARYLREAVRFAIAFQGNGDEDHPVAALVELMADGNKWMFYTRLLLGMAALVLFKIALGMCIRYVARGYLGGASDHHRPSRKKSIA